MPEAMPNIAPKSEPEKILPPRPRTKAEKLARMLEQAEELPPEDVELLEDDVEEIPDTDVELLDADENGQVPSGIHSIPPPPSAEKADFLELDHAMLQHDRVIEAETVRLIDGITATFTMEKSSKREDSERNEDNIFIHEDPEIGPMAGVADGLGEQNTGTGALASEKIVAVLPMRLQDAYDAVRSASPEQLREAAEKLPIIARSTGSKDLMHAKTPEQKRSALLLETHPDIARKAIAISEALKAANKDVQESGGKTTVSFSVIHIAEDGKRFAITANIGDSGTLLRKASGDVAMVTMEDSTLDEFIEAGLINPELLARMRAEPNKTFTLREIPVTYARIEKNEKIMAQLKSLEMLTPEILQAMKNAPEKTFTLKVEKTYEYLKRANTQALGGPEVNPRITVTELEEGDTLVALTDGYFDFLEQDGELNLNTIKSALTERDSAARMNGLREITGVMFRLQKQNEENLKEPDDMAAVELSV